MAAFLGFYALNRCCRRSILDKKLSPEHAADSTIVECRWCLEDLIVRNWEWGLRYPPLPGTPTITRERHAHLKNVLDPAQDAERHRRADAVTEGRFSKEMEKWK